MSRLFPLQWCEVSVLLKYWSFLMKLHAWRYPWTEFCCDVGSLLIDGVTRSQHVQHNPSNGVLVSSSHRRCHWGRRRWIWRFCDSLWLIKQCCRWRLLGCRSCQICNHSSVRFHVSVYEQGVHCTDGSYYGAQCPSLWW